MIAAGVRFAKAQNPKNRGEGVLFEIITGTAPAVGRLQRWEKPPVGRRRAFSLGRSE